MFFTPHIDRRYFLWHNPLVYGVESCLFLNSILLGVGLAMDAFSVSIANALSESGMKKSRMCFIAGVYAFFQFAMPMIGWICVHTIKLKAWRLFYHKSILFSVNSVSKVFIKLTFFKLPSYS